MTVEIISWSNPWKYGTGLGSNSRPLDQQSDSNLLPDTLPTALRGPNVGLIIIQIVWHSWGYDDLRLITFTNSLAKIRSVWMWAWSGSKLYETHLVRTIWSWTVLYVCLGLNCCILQTSKTQVWPGIILAWSGFKLFDNHGVRRIWRWTVVFCCIYNICLNDDNLYKQFRPRSGLAECGPELDTNFLMKHLLYSKVPQYVIQPNSMTIIIVRYWGRGRGVPVSISL